MCQLGGPVTGVNERWARLVSNQRPLACDLGVKLTAMGVASGRLRIFGLGLVAAWTLVAAPSAQAGHPTVTTAICAPNPVSVGSASTCTTTVTDSSPTGLSPTGAVEFSSDSFGNGAYNGAFSSPGSSCTLQAAGPTASSCTVVYTPSAVGDGSHRIQAVYFGHGGSWDSSLGADELHVGPTTTTLTCMPGDRQTGSIPTLCTAMVHDDATPEAQPTGTVNFSSDSAGDFAMGITPMTSCTLGPGMDAATSLCQISYAPTAVGDGTHQLTADYAGTTAFAPSNGTFTLAVSAPPVVSPPAGGGGSTTTPVGSPIKKCPNGKKRKKGKCVKKKKK